MIENENGDTRVTKTTEKEIKKRLKKGGTLLDGIEEPDTNYWGGSFLVLRGEIIQAEPVEVVKDWKLA